MICPNCNEREATRTYGDARVCPECRDEMIRADEKKIEGFLRDVAPGSYYCPKCRKALRKRSENRTLEEK